MATEPRRRGGRLRRVPPGERHVQEVVMQPRTPRRHVPSAPRRRGAWSLTAGAALATVALASCALVPPVAVNDPLGLHGATVEVVFGGGAAVLAPLAADGADDVTFTFDDVAPAELPHTPRRLINTLVGATATIKTH